MARHPLHHETIVSSQETGEVVEVVDQVAAAAVAMEATMVVHMEDRMEGRHLVQTGGGTSCLLPGSVMLS